MLRREERDNFVTRDNTRLSDVLCLEKHERARELLTEITRGFQAFCAQKNTRERENYYYSYKIARVWNKVIDALLLH